MIRFPYRNRIKFPFFSDIFFLTIGLIEEERKRAEAEEKEAAAHGPCCFQIRGADG